MFMHDGLRMEMETSLSFLSTIPLMLAQINNYFRSKKEYGPVFIRLMAGFHLIYGVQDNILNWDRMLEFRNFLDMHHFPLPLLSAIISVYAQLVCGILFMLGFYTRVAAAVMIV